uniref:Uncharacterized protein n=1 Tax=Bionectria ochroleuca TaxID=29856 RepID=A0A8H7KBS2_BIOOC
MRKLLSVARHQALDRLSIQDDDALPLTPAKPKILLPSGKAPRQATAKATKTTTRTPTSTKTSKTTKTGEGKGSFKHGDLDGAPLDQVPGYPAPSWIRTNRTFEALPGVKDVPLEDSTEVFHKWQKFGHPKELKVVYSWKAEATHPNVIACYTQFKSSLAFQSYIQKVGMYPFYFSRSSLRSMKTTFLMPSPVLHSMSLSLFPLPLSPSSPPPPRLPYPRPLSSSPFSSSPPSSSPPSTSPLSSSPFSSSPLSSSPPSSSPPSSSPLHPFFPRYWVRRRVNWW